MERQSYRAELIKTASGLREADLIIKDAQVLNVFTGEFVRGNVAVHDGHIAGVGDYAEAAEIIDARGQYLVPGFINAHCHVESSMVSPEIYCAEELRWGVTTIIADPHEVANVAGADGIRFMLEALSEEPVNCYIQMPSCVPATKYETSGAELCAKEMEALFREPGFLGLGELMDYPGVLRCEPDLLDKLEAAEGRIVDGHAPELTGRGLSAYAAAGVHTDHESVSFSEAREKLRAGIAVLIREGGSCKNLDELVSGILDSKINTGFTAFCSDDKHLGDIKREGTIRNCVRKAIALGLDPAEAYCMGTINAARIYRLWNIGAIAPGYRADMVLISDLENVEVSRVFKDGRDLNSLDSRDRIGKTKPDTQNSVRLTSLNPRSFELPVASDEGYPVVGIVSGQIITRKSYVPAERAVEALKTGELCKIAVIERHRATGNIGVGLLKGYGLKNGAVASTVAHDSHNLIVVGDNDGDMLLAAREAGRIGGGFVLARNGELAAALPLPVYGLMSDIPADEFIPELGNMLRLLHDAGVEEDIDPLLTLSFLALPVIPEIRVTDKGVFDVARSKFL